MSQPLNSRFRWQRTPLVLILLWQLVVPPILLAKPDHDDLVKRIHSQTGSSAPKPATFDLQSAALPIRWEGLGRDQQRRLKHMQRDMKSTIALFVAGQLPAEQLPELYRLSRRLQRDFDQFVRDYYLSQGTHVEVAPRSLLTLLVELNDHFLRDLAATNDFDPRAASEACIELANLAGRPQLQLDLILLSGAQEQLKISPKQFAQEIARLRDERGIIILTKYEKWVEKNWPREVAKPYLSWLTDNRKALHGIIRADSGKGYSLQQRKILRSHGFFSAEAFMARNAVAKEQATAAINFAISKVIADAFLSFVDFTVQRTLDRKFLTHSPLPKLWEHMTHLVSGSMMMASLVSFGVASQFTKSLLLAYTYWAPDAARAEEAMMHRLTSKGATAGRSAAKLGLKEFIGIAGISSIPMGTAMLFSDAIFGVLQHPDFKAALFLFKHRKIFKSDFDLFTRRILTETVFSTMGLTHIATSTVLFMLGLPIASYFVFSTICGGWFGGVLAMAIVLVGVGLFEHFIFQPYMTKDRLAQMIHDNQAAQKQVIERALQSPGELIENIEAMFAELQIDPSTDPWLVRDNLGEPLKVTSRRELARSFLEQTLFGTNPDFFGTFGKISGSVVPESGDLSAFEALGKVLEGLLGGGGEETIDQESAKAKLEEVQHPFLKTEGYKKYLALLEAIPRIQSGRALRQAQDNPAKGSKGFVSQQLAITTLQNELPATTAALQGLFELRHAGALVLQSYEMYRAEESIFSMLEMEDELRKKRHALIAPLEAQIENCSYAIGQEMVLIPLLHMIQLCSSSADLKACLQQRGYGKTFNEATQFRIDLYGSLQEGHTHALDFLAGLTPEQLRELYIYKELERLGPNGDVLRIAFPEETMPESERSAIADRLAIDKTKLLDWLQLHSTAVVGPLNDLLNAEYQERILAEAKDIDWYDNDKQLEARRDILRADICHLQPSACTDQRLLSEEYRDSLTELADGVENNAGNIWTLGLLSKASTWTSLMTSELAHDFRVVWHWLPEIIRRFEQNDGTVKIQSEEEADAFAMLYNGIRRSERQRLRDRFIFFTTTEERLKWIEDYGVPNGDNTPDAAIQRRNAQEIEIVDPQRLSWANDFGMGNILKMFEEDEAELRAEEHEFEQFIKDFEAEFGKEK